MVLILCLLLEEEYKTERLILCLLLEEEYKTERFFLSKSEDLFKPFMYEGVLGSIA